MLEPDLGVGNKMFQNDPPNQHNPQKCVRKCWGPWAGVLLIRTLGTDRIFILEIKPIIRPAFGEPAHWLPLTLTLTKEP